MSVHALCTLGGEDARSEHMLPVRYRPFVNVVVQLPVAVVFYFRVLLLEHGVASGESLMTGNLPASSPLSHEDFPKYMEA